ncbi:thioredoxin domain-containing protein 12-like isoform X1 [Physella acuta]|uniref:thioredoxin domain-containing protein 12-like isoform X1 n=1 Tax=Physella acuta TaxID=109671 RepID=UPI0027DB0C8A|nr:thioredoxin domain-containing protein 12-like isoform X1 [Physella acuta]
MAPFFMFAASTLLGSLAAAAETWGKNIHWVSLREAQRMSKEEKKPTMVVITKTWCRACKALRPKFASNQDIEKFSSNFIMVNLEDDDEPKSVDFRPDGAYYPRILFLDVDGVVMENIYNKMGNRQYKYFYSDVEPIVSNMKEVLRQTGGNKFNKGTEL